MSERTFLMTRRGAVHPLFRPIDAVGAGTACPARPQKVSPALNDAPPSASIRLPDRQITPQGWLEHACVASGRCRVTFSDAAPLTELSGLSDLPTKHGCFFPGIRTTIRRFLPRRTGIRLGPPWRSSSPGDPGAGLGPVRACPGTIASCTHKPLSNVLLHMQHKMRQVLLAKVFGIVILFCKTFYSDGGKGAVAVAPRRANLCSYVVCAEALAKTGS